MADVRGAAIAWAVAAGLIAGAGWWVSPPGFLLGLAAAVCVLGVLAVWSRVGETLAALEAGDVPPRPD